MKYKEYSDRKIKKKVNKEELTTNCGELPFDLSEKRKTLFANFNVPEEFREILEKQDKEFIQRLKEIIKSREKEFIEDAFPNITNKERENLLNLTKTKLSDEIDKLAGKFCQKCFREERNCVCGGGS